MLMRLSLHAYELYAHGKPPSGDLDFSLSGNNIWTQCDVKKPEKMTQCLLGVLYRAFESESRLHCRITKLQSSLKTWAAGWIDFLKTQYNLFLSVWISLPLSLTLPLSLPHSSSLLLWMYSKISLSFSLSITLVSLGTWLESLQPNLPHMVEKWPSDFFLDPLILWGEKQMQAKMSTCTINTH